MCFFRHGSPICYRGRSIPITTDSLILSDRVTPLPSWRLWKLHFFPWAFFFWNIYMLNYKWSVFCEGSHIAKITVGIWLIDLDLIKLLSVILLHVPRGCIDLGRCTFNSKDLMIFHREHFDTIWWIQICNYKAFSLWTYLF